MTTKPIAVDVMGGDFGPSVTVPAICNFLRNSSNTSLYLYGNQELIKPFLPRFSKLKLEVIHTEEFVEMDESPASALRNKKQSSMRMAIEAVASGECSACLSAGNTGALMAISKHVLGMVDGVKRPAICGAVPSLQSHSYLLDMGANVDCDAENLLQFAQMASLLAAVLDNRTKPTVALLNIGGEQNKGNSQVKEAAELLKSRADIHYQGFIEGHEIYEAAADIIVCDGFVGNIALKASEGVAAYIIEKIKQEISSDPLSRFLSLFAVPEFKRIKNKIDPRRFNGASLLGLQGIVVKSHGHADVDAFEYALHRANTLARADFINKLGDQF